jgi:intein-encoded DNA endonuclease-like protein
LEKYFNITVTGPYLVKEAGEVSVKKSGEKIKSIHKSYRIDVSRKQDVKKFLNEIGFSIVEKQHGLPCRKTSSKPHLYFPLLHNNILQKLTRP